MEIFYLTQDISISKIKKKYKIYTAHGVLLH